MSDYWTVSVLRWMKHSEWTFLHKVCEIIGQMVSYKMLVSIYLRCEFVTNELDCGVLLPFPTMFNVTVK